MYLEETKRTLHNLVGKYLSKESNDFSRQVKLIDYSPKDEARPSARNAF